MSDQLDRGQPRFLAPHEAALEAIAHAREAALFTQTAVDELLEIAGRGDRPAEMRVVQLSAAQPIVNDRHRNAYKSIGIWNPGPPLNPAGLPVYLGLAGSSARPGAGIPAIPSAGITVLPLSDIDFEVGVDPAQIGGNTVTVVLFFYDAVQPLFIDQGGVTDISDRAARQLGRVAILDQGTGALLGIDTNGRVTVKPPTGWSAFSAPAANVVASATRAGAAGVTHVCEAIIATLSAVVAPAAAFAGEVVLRDGASGVGAILFQAELVIPAAIGNAPPLIVPGISIDGTNGNAMTLEFTAAGGAGVVERITLVGFDR